MVFAKTSKAKEVLEPCFSMKNFMTMPVRRAYLFFGVRQGAMIIAINDLLWCSFLVFLLVLAASHAREANAMVDADAKVGLQTLPGSGHGHGHATGANAPHEPQTPLWLRRDEEAADKSRSPGSGTGTGPGAARILPRCCGYKVMSGSLGLAIVITAIDMVACVMLLFGAILRVRSLMMPWMSIRLVEIIVLCSTLMVSSSFLMEGVAFAKLVSMGILILLIVFYHWLVVFSFHETLCMSERSREGQLKHSVHDAAPAVPAGQVPDPNILFSNDFNMAMEQGLVLPVCTVNQSAWEVSDEEERRQQQQQLQHHYHHHHHLHNYQQVDQQQAETLADWDMCPCAACNCALCHFKHTL